MSAKIRSTSAKVAAEKFGIGPRILTELARHKKIPASRIGSIWRFDLDELAAHFEQAAKGFWAR